MTKAADNAPRKRIRRRLLLGIVLPVAGAVAFYASSNHSAPILSYRISDHQTLVLTVGGGAATWTRVTQVTESEEEVRIAAESLDWPVARTLEMRLLEFTIVLSSDLGDRSIRDVSGSFVPRVEPASE